MTAWTEERRRRQAEHIRKHKPWEKSTGPRTEKGKKRSSKNALKHGRRVQEFDWFNYLFWLNSEFLHVMLHLNMTDYGDLFETSELLKLKKLSRKNKGPHKDPRGDRP